MSFSSNWNIYKYMEDHESDEHWELRKAFMERWKHQYPEERLVCLARVFANIEFMGCRYPVEIMQEVAKLSSEVADEYRKSKKGKLQRTFVSASDAAEDRAKGIKRAGGKIVEDLPKKSTKINFVPQGQSNEPETIVLTDSDDEDIPSTNGLDKKNSSNNNSNNSSKITPNRTESKINHNSNELQEDSKNEVPSNAAVVENKVPLEVRTKEYFEEMKKVKCLALSCFDESMFQTNFGKFVLLMKPWVDKLVSIYESCQACNVPSTSTYENGLYTLKLNGVLLAQATGSCKADAMSIVRTMAWNRLREEAISVIVKDRWMAQGDAKISVNDVSGSKKPEFGTRVENNVAMKMMQMMGWKGGGLGADLQGIQEPIMPNLQMVNRAGLGSKGTDIRQFRQSANRLMQRYKQSDEIDFDLLFSSEFSKEERAMLHETASRMGLFSKSYGSGNDRFLVVRQKMDPFSLVKAVIQKGGSTPKYQVYIPTGLITSKSIR